MLHPGCTLELPRDGIPPEEAPFPPILEEPFKEEAYSDEEWDIPAVEENVAIHSTRNLSKLQLRDSSTIPLAVEDPGEFP